MKQAELRYYISINVNGQHPLMRSAQGYTEYYSEALEFSDLFDAYRFVERHGLEKTGIHPHTANLIVRLPLYYRLPIGSHTLATTVVTGTNGSSQ